MKNQVIVRNPLVLPLTTGLQAREVSIVFHFMDYAVILISDNSCGADTMVRKSIIVNDKKHEKNITSDVYERAKQLYGIKANIIGGPDQGEIIDFDSVEMLRIMQVVKDMVY